MLNLRCPKIIIFKPRALRKKTDGSIQAILYFTYKEQYIKSEIKRKDGKQKTLNQNTGINHCSKYEQFKFPY